MKARPLPTPWAYVTSYLACLPPLPDDHLPCTIRRLNGEAVTVPRRYARALVEARLAPLPSTEDQIT